MGVCVCVRVLVCVCDNLRKRKGVRDREKGERKAQGEAMREKG